MLRADNLNKLQIIKSQDQLNCALFPFELMFQVVAKAEYETICRRYAELYHLESYREHRQFLDWLHPIVLCIYHKDSRLLRSILDKHGYPARFETGSTPIWLCGLMNQNTCLKTICIFLMEKDLVAKVHFTKHDFKTLLKSNSKYCHRVISRMFRLNNKHIISTVRVLPHNYHISQYASYLEFIKTVKNENLGTARKSGCSRQIDQKQKANPKKKAEVFVLPFEFDFSMGSLQSIEFLD